jgi:CRISPR-associated protein Cas2
MFPLPAGGEEANRRVSEEAMQTLVVYDIPNDRARGKIADACLDYGLDRIQYSAFLGNLERTHQEELLIKIGKQLGKRPGKVHLFTMCEKDWRLKLEIVQEAQADEDDKDGDSGTPDVHGDGPQAA